MKNFNSKKTVLMGFLLSAFALSTSALAATTPHYQFVKQVNKLAVAPTSDTTTPSQTPAPVTAPLAILSTQALAFGEVPVGTPQELTVRLGNTGNAPLVLTGAPALTGSSTFAFKTPGGTSCTSSVSAGASCDTTVVYTPVDATAAKGSLTFTANNAGAPLTVSLTGSGVSTPATLAVASGSSADFGQVLVGQSATRDFVLTNPGTKALTGVMAHLNLSELSFVTNNCGSPGAGVTLAPGASCTMTLAYRPAAGGTLNSALDTLSLSSTDTQTKALTGIAVGDPSWSAANVLLASFDSNYNDIAGARVGTANHTTLGSIGLSTAAGTSMSGGSLAVVNTLGLTGSSDASANGLTFPASTAGNDIFSMGSGNFTVEGWFKWTSFRATKNTKCPGAIYVWTLAGSCNISWTAMGMSLSDTTAASSTLHIILSTSAMPLATGPDIVNGDAAGAVNLNTWYHVALVRNGTAMTVYLNGSPTWTKTVAANMVMGSVSDTTRFPAPGFGLGGGYRGQNYTGTTTVSGDGMTGYIDEFRITKGVARYTGAFTPAAVFPHGK